MSIWDVRRKHLDEMPGHLEAEENTDVVVIIKRWMKSDRIDMVHCFFTVAPDQVRAYFKRDNIRFEYCHVVRRGSVHIEGRGRKRLTALGRKV